MACVYQVRLLALIKSKTAANKQSEPAACRQQAAELVGAEGVDREEEEDDTAATAKQMTAIKLMSWQIWNHLGADEHYQDDDDDDDSDDHNVGVYFSCAPAPLSLSLSLSLRVRHTHATYRDLKRMCTLTRSQITSRSKRSRVVVVVGVNGCHRLTFTCSPAYWL